MASITAASITLRSTKGSPLTNAEVDANFTNLNTAIATGQTAASYTAADVLTKLNTVTGPTAASGLNSDTLTFASGARSAAATNTANTIVARDSSGNFAAAAITATTFSGTFSGVSAITSGSMTLTTQLAIGSGGTGATTAAGARTSLGLAIGSDVQAYTASGNAIAGLTSAADTAPYWTGAGTAGTYTASSYMRGLMASAAAINARSTLGLTIGTDVQAYSAELTSTAGLSTNGLVIRTGAGTKAVRTITATTGISITNGDGVAGNPTIGADVQSVQGMTGAVIVSVPVTSVQGQTGALIVTNIGGNAGSASSVAWGNVSGRPGHLSQFANDLGNYGAWVPHNTKTGPSPGWRIAGAVGNCTQHGQRHGDFNRFHLDTGSSYDAHYHHHNCHNCNCNC